MTLNKRSRTGLEQWPVVRATRHGVALRLSLMLGPLCLAGAAPCQTRSFAAPEAPASSDSYGADLLPKDEKARASLLRTLAFDATIYGMSAYLHYEQLYRQVYDRTSSNYTGFNRFAHDRDLAGPDYATFKVPNTDTLYSTAWIDLTQGPVEVQIPPTRLKYFTLNIFDIFGNPSNLSNRTIGFDGGRYLLVPPGWQGKAPDGAAVYRAATPQLWILMRAFAQSGKEVRAAREFQDTVRIVPRVEPKDQSEGAAPTPPRPAPGATSYLEALDHLLRVNGWQPGEEALVARFRPLGILAEKPFGPASFDPVARAAIEAGYAEALDLITKTKSQLGQPTGTGWMKVDKGVYGFNYVRRSVTNMAGLGANVREENASYTAFVDGTGKALNGATSRYTLNLKTPPPVNAFWSVTLYDGASFALYPNTTKRYLVSDRTPGLKKAADGSIQIRIQHAGSAEGNWLPAPAGPFFVVLRAYSPKPEMLTGQWLPPAIIAEGAVR